MTCRATRRERVLVSRGVHRHYRETLATYFTGGELAVDEVPLVADGPAAGTTDLAALERLLADTDHPVAGVVPPSPTSSGCSSRWPRSAASPTPPAPCSWRSSSRSSLAVLAPPGAYGADIAAGEGQPLGIPPQYGGPYLGILACTDALVRQIPGRLVGMTTDIEGRRAFVMTMRAREQDIRRDKAASNICTNQALLALAATIYLATIGPARAARRGGRRRARAAELEAALAAVGVARLHPGAYLNEFAIRVPDAPAVHRRLLGRGVLAGLALADARARRPDPRRRAPRLHDRGHDRPPRSRRSPAPWRDRRWRRAGAGAAPESADERHRAPPPADALRAVPPRSRGRQDPASAQGRARAPAGRQRADGPAGPAGDERAGRRPPLREPVASSTTRSTPGSTRSARAR